MAQEKKHQLTITFKGMVTNSGTIFYSIMDEKSEKTNFPPNKGNNIGVVKHGELKLKHAKFSDSSENGSTYEMSTTITIPTCTIAVSGFHSVKGIDKMEMYKLGPIQIPKDGIFVPEGYQMWGTPKWKPLSFEVNEDITKELKIYFIMGATEMKLTTVEITSQKKNVKLGIIPKSMNEGKSLVVKEILSKGIIPAWNKMHKSDKLLMVKKEDILVSINGEPCQDWITQQIIDQVAKLLQAQTLTKLEFGRITKKKKEIKSNSVHATVSLGKVNAGYGDNVMSNMLPKEIVISTQAVRKVTVKAFGKETAEHNQKVFQRGIIIASDTIKNSSFVIPDEMITAADKSIKMVYIFLTSHSKNDRATTTTTITTTTTTTTTIPVTTTTTTTKRSGPTIDELCVILKKTADGLNKIYGSMVKPNELADFKKMTEYFSSPPIYEALIRDEFTEERLILLTQLGGKLTQGGFKELFSPVPSMDGVFDFL